MEHSTNMRAVNTFETSNLTDVSQPIYTGNNSVYNAWQAFPEIEAPILSLSKIQMRKALIYFNVLEQVEEAATHADAETQHSWQSATHFERQDKFLNEIAKKLHLTSKQLDFIFEMGITL
jgi:hypothetical protein